MTTIYEVPEFDTFELKNKKSKYCICIFIINEGEKFLKQLSRMQHYQDSVDIIIADGGSTDGSTDIANLEKYEVNTLLVKTGAGKLGAQMRMAFSWATKRDYDGIIVIDGNNKDGIEAIPNFINKLDEGYDHIQGSRFIKGGHHENTPFSRLLGLKILHAPLIRFASGFNYTDTTNGFRAYSKRLLTDDKISIFRNIFTGYELHYYLAIMAAKLGFKCIEIPVSRVYPKEGKTPTKISPFKGNITVILKLLQVVSGKYRP